MRVVVTTIPINSDMNLGFSAVLAGEMDCLIRVISPARNVGQFRSTLYAVIPERLKREYE